jgi:hypothetical protein
VGSLSPPFYTDDLSWFILGGTRGTQPLTSNGVVRSETGYPVAHRHDWQPLQWAQCHIHSWLVVILTRDLKLIVTIKMGHMVGWFTIDRSCCLSVVTVLLSVSSNCLVVCLYCLSCCLSVVTVFVSSNCLVVCQ